MDDDDDDGGDGDDDDDDDGAEDCADKRTDGCSVSRAPYLEHQPRPMCVGMMIVITMLLIMIIMNK